MDQLKIFFFSFANREKSECKRFRNGFSKNLFQIEINHSKAFYDTKYVHYQMKQKKTRC